MKRLLVLSTGCIGVCVSKVYFKETFDNLDKWITSRWKGNHNMAQFELKAHKFAKKSSDLSLATTMNSKFYGISAAFEPFSNEAKTLVVQYEAKYDGEIECGGGYIKLGPKMEDQTKFGEPTPYNIMFGPDKCGHRKRTHLIFSYKGKNVLKTIDLPYGSDTFEQSALYRLVLKPDNTVKVYIDRKEVFSGDLKKDWKMLEPEEIVDVEDTKPKDWVEIAEIDDPSASKPADWVEVRQIIEPGATKPDDWDDDEDGEWEPPLIDNPDYKGEWKPKKIPNPEYKGVWVPRKIPNSKYVADDELYKYKDFGYVGFDIWQVKAQAFYDNLIIADDETEANKMADAWQKLVEHEKEQKKSTTTTTTTRAFIDEDDNEDL